MAVKKWVLWGAALVLLAAGVAVVWRADPDDDSGRAASTNERDAKRARPAAATSAAAGPVRDEAEVQRYRDWLHSRYTGEKLKSAYVQLKLLEDLIRFFQKRYPNDWERMLLEFLRETYPERYEELAAKLRARLAYERWMKENDSYLQQLGNEERRKNVWEERERLFGQEAAEEIWASERKHQAMADALTALDARTDVNASEKVKLYRDSLEGVHGDQTDAFLERHRQEAMNAFLDLSSVQKELAGLTPDERSKSLREIRSGLGLDVEALQRWDALDATRDARWEAGAAYMQERERLAKQYSGAALEEQLRPVRERYFGGEAETIASEEESGFFRFSRPRTWGRN